VSTIGRETTGRILPSGGKGGGPYPGKKTTHALVRYTLVAKGLILPDKLPDRILWRKKRGKKRGGLRKIEKLNWVVNAIGIKGG